MLTNVARASLEELTLDYEDFLRQRELSIWSYQDPRRIDLIKQRLTTADQFVRWVQKQAGFTPEVAANGILILLKVVCTLLDRQLIAQAEALQKRGPLRPRSPQRPSAKNNFM